MLTDHERDLLQKKLEEERADLERQLGRLPETLDFGSETDHFEEETDEAEELANQLGVKKSFEERLERVKNALAKFRNDTYGICESCRKPIAAKLLSIDPESELCQDCKAKQNR